MDKKTLITQGLRKLGRPTDDYQIAQVTSIDEDKFICTCTDKDIEYEVQLSASDQKSGLIQIPSIGSIIIFKKINEGSNILLMTSEISKLIILIDSSKLVIDKDGFIFNDGKNGGMPISLNIVNKLNSLEEDLNAIKTVFKSWVPIPSDGAASLKTLLSFWYSNNITLTQTTDLVNDKLKQ